MTDIISISDPRPTLDLEQWLQENQLRVEVEQHKGSTWRINVKPAKGQQLYKVEFNTVKTKPDKAEVLFCLKKYLNNSPVVKEMFR